MNRKKEPAEEEIFAQKWSTYSHPLPQDRPQRGMLLRQETICHEPTRQMYDIYKSRFMKSARSVQTLTNILLADHNWWFCPGKKVKGLFSRLLAFQKSKSKFHSWLNNFEINADKWVLWWLFNFTSLGSTIITVVIRCFLCNHIKRNKNIYTN